MRAHLLRYDLRIAVSVHEAGHVFMAQRHGLGARVRLPQAICDQQRWNIEGQASVDIQSASLTVAGAIDVCFAAITESSIYTSQRFWRQDRRFGSTLTVLGPIC